MTIHELLLLGLKQVDRQKNRSGRDVLAPAQPGIYILGKADQSLGIANAV